MSIALYRKYRPKSFKEVSGQNHIKITLQNEIVNDHLGHAYLFCGPRGTGKTSMARLFSKSVNCQNPKENAEPCNECESCKEIMDGRALDIIEIDAASHTGVDNVRENIIQNARFTPAKSKYKVFIIDEVHMLSISAFNALLKILEEPPKYVIFILATTEAHKIPATIISRCQRFDFKRIVAVDLVDRLRWIVKSEGVNVDDAVLLRIARQVNGCVRDSESLLEQVISIGGNNITLETAELILPTGNEEMFLKLFEGIIKKQTSESIKLINKLIVDGVDVVQFTDSFVEFLRKILVFYITKDSDEFAREFDEQAQKIVNDLSTRCSDRELSLIIERILRSKDLFKQTNIPQLPLEIAVVDLTAPRAFTSGTPVNPIATVNPVVPVAPSLVVEPGARNPEQSATLVNSFPVTGLPVAPSPSFHVELSPEESAALANIQGAWSEILSRLHKDNYSLYMSFKMAKPVALKGQTLTLGFLYDLQRKKVADIKTKVIAEDFLNSIFNQKFILDCVIVPDLDLGNSSVGGATNGSVATADDLANMFGGTIVSG